MILQKRSDMYDTGTVLSGPLKSRKTLSRILRHQRFFVIIDVQVRPALTAQHYSASMRSLSVSSKFTPYHGFLGSFIVTSIV